VKYVLSNGKDYKGAARRYSLNYSTIYRWVKLYTSDGEEGLKTKRMRT